MNASQDQNQNQDANRRISIQIVGREGKYDFTYTPSTVHVNGNEVVDFELVRTSVVDKVWVAFDVPVSDERKFNFSVSKGKAARVTFRTVPPGVHHYRVIGFAGPADGEQYLVADVYCPSIIVN